MKHTQGKMKIGRWLDSHDKPVFELSSASSPFWMAGVGHHDDIEKAKADAERIASILTAANGMPTEEAVKYIEYGPEMVEFIKTTKKLMSGISPDAISAALRLDAKDILTKLEAK